MAVSWVAGTAPAHAQSDTLAANAPSGLADFDMLLAAVFAVSAITAPSGWTKVTECATFSDSEGVDGRLELWAKNSVSTSDSGASFTWGQADFDTMAVAYAAMRDVLAIDTTSTASEDLSTDWSVTIPTLAGTDAGQMLLSIAATTDAASFSSETRTPTPPSGTTLGTGTPAAYYRVAIAYRTAGASDSISGAFALHNSGTPPSDIGIGAISVRLSTPTADPEGIISAAGPLGEPSAVGYQVAGFVAVDGPLGTASARAWHDPSGIVDQFTPVQYVMDLVTPDGDVRAPISSWQATLQVDAAQYVQCVVPSPAALVDTIADATHFRLFRVLQLVAGGSVPYLIAEAPVQTVSYARGSTNYSATISGYTDALPELTWPPETERTLTKIRAVFSSESTLRVSCAIDWLLSPGQSAIADGTPLTVDYVSYFVNGQDSYMDVGQRTEPP